MFPKYRSPKHWEREKERKEREGQERYKNNSVLYFDVKYYSQPERQFVNVSGKNISIRLRVGVFGSKRLCGVRTGLQLYH